LLNYIQTRRKPGEVVLYFMPTGSGPCRFGQYHIFMEDLVSKMKIPDVAMLSLSSDDGYNGLPTRVHRRIWWSILISDVFEDMRSMLLADARDPQASMDRFKDVYANVIKALSEGIFDNLQETLKDAADQLGRIALKKPVWQVPLISLTGEIFVRRDNLSRQLLTEQLAAKGFATVCAPVAEWVLYSDYVVNNRLSGKDYNGWRDRIAARIKQGFMRKDEKRIKKILSASGLVHAEPIQIKPILETARPYISPYLGGEAVLTVGGSLKEIATETCGVIAIGPFGCMPNRLSEAILNESMKRQDKIASAPTDTRLKTILSDMNDLPFLSIESDGSPFPQLIHAKLEAFCLRAQRLHHRMLNSRKNAG
jgi:predicted nucleotide-binding protein (sugar kinase/HSP70/actin superfamily)